MELIQTIQQVGFPIAVSIYLLVQTSKQLNSVTLALNKNTDVINDLKEIIKINFKQ